MPPGPHQTLERFFGRPSRDATRFDRSTHTAKTPHCIPDLACQSYYCNMCGVTAVLVCALCFAKTTQMCKLTFLVIPSWATRKPPRLLWTCMNLFIFSNT